MKDFDELMKYSRFWWVMTGCERRLFPKPAHRMLQLAEAQLVQGLPCAYSALVPAQCLEVGGPLPHHELPVRRPPLPRPARQGLVERACELLYIKSNAP